jgi:hypothetical protein
MTSPLTVRIAAYATAKTSTATIVPTVLIHCLICDHLLSHEPCKAQGMPGQPAIENVARARHFEPAGEGSPFIEPLRGLESKNHAPKVVNYNPVQN